MQKLLLLTVAAFLCLHTKAQLPEDALRNSWTTPGGTARQQAIGGAMGSLGGEISANFVNPAGLGFYRNNEIVLSPGWRVTNDKSTWMGNKTSGPNTSRFSLGTSGIVTSHQGLSGLWNVFSVAVNRTADFNNHIHFQGNNDYSSFSEQWVEEYARSGYGDRINDAIASPDFSYGTRMALYTSLVDTATIGGVHQVISQAQKAGQLFQDNDLRTTGGITEIALNLATGLDNKWFIGGGLGIPIMSYSRYQTWVESDATGNASNDFQSFVYRENFSSKGWGLNAKLGVIFKPNNAWRIGLAIHTPTVFSVTDKVNSSLISRTENYVPGYPQISISSDSVDYGTGNQPSNVVNYSMFTPWKFIISGSYIFGGGVADPRKQKGFITADLEYATVHSSHFKPESDGSESVHNYFDAVNQSVRDSYKNTLALRLGGELKFNTLAARAGAAYYTNPYKASDVLKADRILLSAGGGWRYAGFFVDLAYVMAFNRDIYVPYYLNDKSNIFSEIKQRSGTVVLTVGMKL
jgi:hypothetical protein